MVTTKVMHSLPVSVKLVKRRRNRKREVKEETGLGVTDIQYYKSQPWSFSSTLLFGFWCKAHGDSPIQMDENELRVARWADREEEINSLDNASLTTEMIQYYKQGKVV